MLYKIADSANNELKYFYVEMNVVHNLLLLKLLETFRNIIRNI